MDIPRDIWYHVTQKVFEDSPRSSINLRILNRQFKADTDFFIQAEYESELVEMLSACRITVLSPKARLKYTLQYMNSINIQYNEDADEADDDKYYTNYLPDYLTEIAIDIIFCALFFFFVFT